MLPFALLRFDAPCDIDVLCHALMRVELLFVSIYADC